MTWPPLKCLNCGTNIEIGSYSVTTGPRWVHVSARLDHHGARACFWNDLNRRQRDAMEFNGHTFYAEVDHDELVAREVAGLLELMGDRRQQPG
jgi:hypothetical protein